MISIRKRLPVRNEINVVLGVVIFFVHGWSVRGFLHEVPSFIQYFRPDQIVVIFSYMMAFALLESLLVLLGLILISVILPPGWFRTGFIYKSFITVVVGAIAMLRLEATIMNTNYKFPPESELYLWVLISVGAWSALILLFHFIERFQLVALDIADRIAVMAYIYFPLGVLGLIVVAYRNLW